MRGEVLGVERAGVRTIRGSWGYPPMAFLDQTAFVRVATVPPPTQVLGGQDRDLGCERKIDQRVGRIIAQSAPSDGLDGVLCL